MPNLPYTLRQLDIFEAVCETLSFRETSERLGITQASVSNQVAQLEMQMGIKLFARSPGKRPSLTRQGLAFRADLQQFREASRKLASHRAVSSKGETGSSFRILIGQVLFDNYVRPQLDQFLGDHPLIECEFVTHFPTDRLSSEFRNGNVDFAMFHHRADMPIELECKCLALIRSGIYGTAQYAGNSDLPLSPEEITGLPFILPKAGSDQEIMQLNALSEHKIHPHHIICHTDYIDVTCTMVERGLGIACIAESFLSPETRLKLVQLYPLANWHLMWFRVPDSDNRHANQLEDFLLSSVARNPGYPTIETYV
ncbi:MAG: LysR family transcriptional regulator [Sphingomonadaceae bacterium]